MINLNDYFELETLTSEDLKSAVKKSNFQEFKIKDSKGFTFGAFKLKSSKIEFTDKEIKYNEEDVKFQFPYDVIYRVKETDQYILENTSTNIAVLLTEKPW